MNNNVISNRRPALRKGAFWIFQILPMLLMLAGVSPVSAQPARADAAPVTAERNTRTWTDPGGSGLQITFSTPLTAPSCSATGDNIYTQGIPDNWSLNGYVEVSVHQADGTWAQAGFYPVFQNGNLNLNVAYPPAWTWPIIQGENMRELHIDIVIYVQDENGQTINWVGGDVNSPTGVLGPGQDWDVFCSNLADPKLSIAKYTNGADANDPNGTDVPVLAPGATVTWTYQVSNTGDWPINKAFITVSDNQTGVTPAFDHEISGNGDDVLDPGEVWLYSASGIAANLTNPPAEMIVQENACTRNGSESPRTAYVNIGKVSIPGLEFTDPSSYCNPPAPGVEIIKYTNGQVASDPNGGDVPFIKPGDPVVWTYKVTNSGQTAVPQNQVLVTDDQPGITPVFDHEISGNGDAIFNPGEVWLYTASGIAVNLSAPPAEVKTIPGVCTLNQTLDPSTAYVNHGTVTIPGNSKSAQSTYCNPKFKYYLPFGAVSNEYSKDWHVAVGYEDLPLIQGKNDYDYNDWITDIDGTATFNKTDNGLKMITFNVNPHARGATYDHEFHIKIPKGTFSSNGRAELLLEGADHGVISVQNFTFTAAADNDFTIFSKTSDVFPGEVVDTVENWPFEAPQRWAVLNILFDNAMPFDLTQYNFALPEGDGLFFDPFIHVLNTGEEVHAHNGDIRILTVPDTQYLWPEESVRLDRAYPNTVVFNNTNPPTINFAPNWWLQPNHCIYDGVACVLPFKAQGQPSPQTTLTPAGK